MSKKQLKKITTKSERLAMKEAKKKGNLKTRPEREAEIKHIRDQLAKWQLDDRFPPVAELFAEMDRYVETGEYSAGKIPFPEAPPQPQGRNIVYAFPRSRGRKCTCDLIVRDGSKYVGGDVPRAKLPSLSPPASGSSGGPFGPSGPECPVVDDPELVAFEAELRSKIPGLGNDVSEAVPETTTLSRAEIEAMVPSAEEIQKCLDNMVNSAPAPSATADSGSDVVEILPDV